MRRPAKKTTTWPVIPTNQNGSGIAAQMLEYFDICGNKIWNMDERGFITGFTVDIPTGAMTQRIDDVNTAAGEALPFGGLFGRLPPAAACTSSPITRTIPKAGKPSRSVPFTRSTWVASRQRSAGPCGAFTKIRCSRRGLDKGTVRCRRPVRPRPARAIPRRRSPVTFSSLQWQLRLPTRRAGSPTRSKRCGMSL